MAMWETGGKSEADVYIVYPSLAFNLQLCHLKDPDSQQQRCSQYYLLKSNRDLVFLWANFFQIAAYPAIHASSHGNSLPPGSIPVLQYWDVSALVRNILPAKPLN